MLHPLQEAVVATGTGTAFSSRHVAQGRKPELFEQSPFQSVLPSLRVLRIYFSSKQESQSFPLCFLAYPTPEKGVGWPRWQDSLSQISVGQMVCNLWPPIPPNIFRLFM